MRVKKLSDREVRTLGSGLHSDGGGLYLNVKATGARSWVFVYRFDGRRREMGLGGYPDVKLAEARVAAAEAMVVVRRGGDPIEERKAAVSLSEPVPAADIDDFEALAKKVIADLSPGWRGAKTKQNWERSLLRQAAPLHRKRPAEITTQDIIDVLAPYWTSRPESAGKLRERLELALDVAKVNGQRDGENPARWRNHLSLKMPKRKRLVRGHHSALPYEKAPAFMSKLLKQTSMGARALAFVILTAVREGVARGAIWSEISDDFTIWTIPKARMKSERDLIVPLSAPAQAILKDLDPTGGKGRPSGSSLVFPGRRSGRPLSNTSVAKPLIGLGVAHLATIHGFRSTLRDWAGDETDHARDVVEMALAHLVGDETERAYRRRDALKKRRALLDDWAAYLTGSGQAASGLDSRSTSA